MPGTQKPALLCPPHNPSSAEGPSGPQDWLSGLWAPGFQDGFCSEFRLQIRLTQERRARWRRMPVFSPQDGNPGLTLAFYPCPSWASCEQVSSPLAVIGTLRVREKRDRAPRGAVCAANSLSQTGFALSSGTCQRAGLWANTSLLRPWVSHLQNGHHGTSQPGGGVRGMMKRPAQGASCHRHPINGSHYSNCSAPGLMKSCPGAHVHTPKAHPKPVTPPHRKMEKCPQ